MNWKLIVLLSLFGLAMGIATVFVIPSNIEPVFWFLVFIISAFLIAKNCSDRLFLHGLLVSLLNSVWVTAIHVLLFNQYVSNHAEEMSMMATLPFPGSPKLQMLIMAPVFGVVSGAVLGLFAVVAGRFVSPNKSS